MDIFPKFLYLKELTQLISGVSVVHTDILRFFQYCDETHAGHFKCMKKCHRYVPITRDKILFNCIERTKILNDAAWSQFKLDVLHIRDGRLEAPEIKYIMSQYILTYKNLFMSKEECSRIIQCSPIIYALLDRNTQYWSAFMDTVPKLIDYCYENWQSVASDINLGMTQTPEVPTRLQEWNCKVRTYVIMIENKEETVTGEPGSSDSEDEDSARMPREDRRKILSRGTPRKYYPHGTPP